MRRLLREIALTLGAVGGIACLALAIAAAFFGVTPLVVRTNSMAPDMPAGSLALARSVPGTAIAPGDVISVTTPDGTRVTHRVVRLAAPSQVAVSAYLKGDANESADPQPYVVGQADRVVATIPTLGYVVSWFQTLGGRVIGVMVAVSLLYMTFRRPRRPQSTRSSLADRFRQPSLHRSAEEPTSRHRARHAVTSAAVAAGTAAALMTQQVGAAEAAALTDTATMTETMTMGAFEASFPGANGKATISTLSLGVNGCTISWTAPAAGFGVQLSFLAASAALPTDLTSTPTTVQSQYNFPSSTLSYTATAPTDVVGTPTTTQRYTLRTVRTSDGMVSANYSYGTIYRALNAGAYTCTVGDATGANHYTWPAVSAVAPLAASLKSLKVGASSSTTSSSASSSASSSSASSSQSSSSSSSSSAPTTSAAPGTTAASGSSSTSDSTSTATVTEAAGATKSQSGSVTASLTGTTLTLKSSSGETVYTTTVKAGSTLTWDATSDILTVHQPDGSSVIVKKVGDTWTAFDVTNSTAPATTTTSQAPAQTTTDPTTSSQTTTATQQEVAPTSAAVPTVTAAQ